MRVTAFVMNEVIQTLLAAVGIAGDIVVPLMLGAEM